MQLSIPYPREAKQAYWGTPDSNSNFCEEDHVVSSYIAEFISTLTNVIYIFYATEGISRNAHRPNALMDCMPYIGLAGVGVGSMLFHMLLGYYSQMADDLSMLFTTGIVLHRVLTTSTSGLYTALIGISITAFLVGLSYVHCVTDELIMHNVTFGTMIAIIGSKTMRLLRKVETPFIRKKVSGLARAGAVIFISGYVIWLLDNRFCGTLISLRRHVEMPWSFVLELHGWWHILTGIGAYTFIVLVEYLTTEVAGSDPTGLYAWPTSSLLRLGARGAKGRDMKEE